MSLPLPVTSSATAPVVPTVPRSGTTARTPGASPRLHAATRDGVHAPSKGAKGKSGFASVLDAVQQDDRNSASVASGRPDRAQGRSVGADSQPTALTRAADEGLDPTPVVYDESTPVVVAQTPWLLLALGTGSRAWKDAEGVATECPSGADGTPQSAALELAAVADVATIAAGSEVIEIDMSRAPSLPVHPQLAGAHVANTTASDISRARSVDAAADDAAPIAPSAEEGDAADARRVTVAVLPSTREVGDAGLPARVGQTETQSGESRQAQPESTSASRITVPSGVAVPDSPNDLKQDAAVPTRPGDAVVASAPIRTAGRAHLQAVPSATPTESVVVAAAGEAAHVGSADRALVSSTILPERSVEIAGRLGQTGDGTPTQHGTQPGGPHLQAATAVPTPAPLPEVTSTPAPAALPPAVGEQVLNQVVSSLRMQWKDGIGEAKVQLRPDAYGQVSVLLKVEAGAVTAVVRAESADVQEWVVRNQETLRQQLEAAGLRLNQLVVTPDDQRQREQQAPQEQRRRRQPATTAHAGPTFEKLL